MDFSPLSLLGGFRYLVAGPVPAFGCTGESIARFGPARHKRVRRS
jgi:hypothetical protein